MPSATPQFCLGIGTVPMGSTLTLDHVLAAVDALTSATGATTNFTLIHRGRWYDSQNGVDFYDRKTGERLA